MYENGRRLDDFGGRPSWSAVVEEPPKAAGKTPPREEDVYRSERDPIFAVHDLRSEAEAAVAHDYAQLWLRLLCPGCTLEKLRNQKWNKPKLRVWEDAAAVGALARLGLFEVKAAQKYIRTKVLSQLFVLAKRGILPKERAQEVQRYDVKYTEKWLVQCQREENRAKKQWTAAERAGEAALGQMQKQHAQRERAALRLLAQLQRLQGLPSAAEVQREEQERRRAEAKRRAQAEAQTAAKNEAGRRRRAAEARKRSSELKQLEEVSRKRQAAEAAESSREQKRQRGERLARRGGKRVAPQSA